MYFFFFFYFLDFPVSRKITLGIASFGITKKQRNEIGKTVQREK